MKFHASLTLLAISALSACAVTGPAQMAPYSQAALPATMQVPAGHRVGLETSADGDITYQCRANKDKAGHYDWAFAGPDAVLRDRSGQSVGKYNGPPATWESNDGSKITGTQLAVAPNGADNILLQLVKANPAVGQGMMQGVSYIQRVNTKGGIAPKAVCFGQNVGQSLVVSYSADYIFWRAN